MDILPAKRTTLSRPFSQTGVDFAETFHITNFLGRGCRVSRGYVGLFICFATKAIHLEAVSDLSYDAFLASFHRFADRRGCPGHMYSDNGKNFVGASKKLAQDFLAVTKARTERVSVLMFNLY